MIKATKKNKKEIKTKWKKTNIKWERNEGKNKNGGWNENKMDSFMLKWTTEDNYKEKHQ